MIAVVCNASAAAKVSRKATVWRSEPPGSAKLKEAVRGESEVDGPHHHRAAIAEQADGDRAMTGAMRESG